MQRWPRRLRARSLEKSRDDRQAKTSLGYPSPRQKFVSSAEDDGGRGLPTLRAWCECEVGSIGWATAAGVGSREVVTLS
jgi:hypothetical protein